MRWEHDAEEAVERMPIPPMMGSYARLQAEKCARQLGRTHVTLEAVQEAERLYREFVGKEKTEEIRAFIEGRGPAPGVEDELFFQDDMCLYTIDACYTKYGENTTEVREALKDMLRSVRSVLEDEKVTELMADRSVRALHGASRFTVGMTGCPNCCVSPYMKDFGIVMQHRVRVTEAPCSGCGLCVRMCPDGAIELSDDGPVIDDTQCLLCGLCARDCPTGTLQEQAAGFLVLAGGCGGRHPALALPVEAFVSKQRVLELLKNTIACLRHAPSGETLRHIIDRKGVSALT